MSFQRSVMLARAAAPVLQRALPRVNHQQILARVSQLGLSQRAFHQARLTLQATTATPAPAAKAADAKPAAAAAPAAASTAVSAPATSFSDIVAKYGGWYPFIGLAGVIAVSKELLILNEEFLLVSNFAAMFATLYFTLGDTVTKAAEEQRADIARRQDDVSDFEIEALTQLLQAHELNIEQVSVLSQLKKQHNQLSSDLVAAKALKVRHAARDTMVKKLNDIRGREMSERASFRDAVTAKASVYVRREFTRLPAATKQQLVDFAIDVVEGKRKTLDAKADPVKKLYRDFFDGKLYEKEMAAEKQKQ